MNADSLIMQALNITVIGMLVVFVFLIIMVGIMHIMSKVVAWMEKYFPQVTAAPQSAAADNALVAVAIAAARRFRTNK